MTNGSAGARWGRAAGWLLPLGAFVLYLLTLGTLPIVFPEYPSWLYFADNREGLILGVDSVSNNFSIVKHPAYRLVAWPLYALGQLLFAGATPPLDRNLTLALTGAVPGAVAVAVAARAFRSNAPDRWIGWSFALLYPTCLATWVFSSTPDTQSLTSLVVAAYCLALLRFRGTDVRSAAPLAIVNAAACWCSPQALFLSFVFGIRAVLRYRKDIVSIVRQSAIYATVLFLIWALPYYIFLYFGPFGWRAPHLYVKENLAFDLGYLIEVPLNLLVFAISGPPVEPTSFGDPAHVALSEAPLGWWPVFGVVLLVIGAGLRRLPWTEALRGEEPVETQEPLNARLGTDAFGLLAFVAVYIVFFIGFNPREVYLMSMIMLCPWLLVLQTGLAGGGRWGRWLAAAVVVLVPLSNVFVVAHIRALALSDTGG